MAINGLTERISVMVMKGQRLWTGYPRTETMNGFVMLGQRELINWLKMEQRGYIVIL